jgi:hypothetical protein
LAHVWLRRRPLLAKAERVAQEELALLIELSIA